MERTRPALRDGFWTAPRRPAPDLLTVITTALQDPNPYDSAEQFQRFNHDDVAGLSLKAIDKERVRLRFAWGFDLLSDWGHERLGVLDRAAEVRRKRASR
jgi:hypothetical protein